MPDRVALMYDDQRLTHAALNDRTNLVANALSARGLGKGTVVGIFIRNSIAFVEIFFACQKLGLTATPANTRYQADELRHQMSHAAASVIFFDAELASTVAAIRLPDDPRQFICVGENPPPWALSYDRFLTDSTGTAEPPEVHLDRGDVATILYTSGTTGVAKGVPVSYWGGLFTGILEANVDIGLTADDVALCVAPLFHQGVYGMNLMMPLMVGGSVVIQRRFDADETLALIEKHRASFAFFVPTMSEAILRSLQLPARDTASFRAMMSSGSSLPERTKLGLLKAFPGLRLFENYGATETFNSLRLLPRDTLRKHNCVGVPVLTQHVRLVDRVGRDVVGDAVGEITVRGPAVLPGYHNPPAGTGPAVDENGWFRTGDLAQRDAEGYYYIVGRSKEMIISGGENIYPAEIEDIINGMDGVAECAVVGLPDDYWGELVCAFVVRRRPDLTEDQVTSACTQKLARYKCPRKVTFIEAIPRNSAGKIVRRALTQPAAQ